MLQEAGDTEGLQKAAGQLRADRDRYKDFCREKGLAAHNENTQVYGYDRSASMKTVWAERAATIKTEPGVTTDYSVNYDVIHSKEYSNKFKWLTGSIFGDRRVANEARFCVKENDGTLYETVAILDSKNGKRKGDYMRPGEAGGTISIPKSYNNSFIIVHNHGNNDTFSFDDFVLMNNCPQVKTIIAAGHNGIVHKMSVASGKRLDFSDDKEYNFYKNAFGQRYSSERGGIEGILYLCDLLGWEYSYA